MIRFNNLSQNPGRLRWLIGACLLLLGLSQVLWINRIWNEQKENLQQESNYLFQQTVMSMQDSLVRRNMVKNGIPLDQQELPRRKPIFKRQTWGDRTPQIRSETSFRYETTVRDSLTEIPMKEGGQVQIIVARSDSQSVAKPDGLGRLFLNMRASATSTLPVDLVFEIQNDSISPAELQLNYALALHIAELPGTFRLQVKDDPEAFTPSAAIITEPTPAGLLQHRFFLAEFYDYNGYLLKKILPYGLFSLLLMGLISLAFWLIFNTLKQQRKLSQQKNEFISNVTHELKTPLTTVGVALEALHDFEVLRNPEKTREYLQISKLELERLNLLVDKVLRLSMFEQQALQLHPEPLDLVSTTRQVIDAMTLQAQNAGGAMHFHAAEPSCWVSCDRLHFTGVVYNLLDNALKYRRGAPEIEVFVEKTQRDGREFARLQVRDNGIGIEPEFQQQIFEKFFRVPMGNTHNVKGHGLGLSYVAHVVREHGGYMQVESQPGQGSTFTVEIPVATPQPTA